MTSVTTDDLDLGGWNTKVVADQINHCFVRPTPVWGFSDPDPKHSLVCRETILIFDSVLTSIGVNGDRNEFFVPHCTSVVDTKKTSVLTGLVLLMKSGGATLVGSIAPQLGEEGYTELLTALHPYHNQSSCDRQRAWSTVSHAAASAPRTRSTSAGEAIESCWSFVSVCPKADRTSSACASWPLVK